MQQTAAGKKWGVSGAAGWGDSSEDAVWNQSSVSGSGWGDEPPGSTGSAADIGTWRPTEQPQSSWAGQAGAIRTGNEIIVDTKDKEAWPSIGDQSEDGGAGDNNDDAASQKSGSVISTSSQPGQDTSDQNSLKGQGASNGWGQITSDAKDWHKDGTSAWNSTNPRTTASNSLGVSGWGSPSPSPSMNSNQPVGAGLSADMLASTDASHAGPSPAQTPTSAGMWGGMGLGNPAATTEPGQTKTGDSQVGSPWNISDNSSASNFNGTRPSGLERWASNPNATNALGWGRPMSGASTDQAANMRNWQQPSPVPSPNDIPQSGNGQPMNNASIPTSAGWSQSQEKGANNAATAAHPGWGQLPNAAPNQPPPQWGTAPPINPAKTLPGSWAQAAGKGLQSGPTTPSPATNPVVTSPHDQNIQAVNAVQGWGLKPVRQDASWDTEISPRSKRREIESANSNVWNSQVNNGTSLWENAKTTQSKPTQIMAKTTTQVSWNGDMNKPGWGDEQWNNKPAPESASWNGQAPDPNAPNWKNDPPRGAPPMSWAPGNRTNSSSSWEGNNSASNNGPWPDQAGQRGPPGWPGPDRSQSWDGPNPNQAQSPSWDGRQPTGPPSKWTSAKAADVKPSGWDQSVQGASRQASQDDGTAFWGDPSVHKQPPGWGAGSNPTTPQTPTPRMKPDGPGPWDRPPPNVKDQAMWANSAPPNGEDSNSWGPSGSGNQWNKPKPTSFDMSSWGTPIDMWNKPTEPGQQWPDDVSVWGDDNNEMQENALWSSARDFNKKKNMASTMIPPPMTSSSMGAPPGGPGGRNMPQMRIKLLQQLMDMGFKKEDAQRALIDHNLNLENALADLMANADAAEIEAHKAMKARGLHSNDMHNDKFGPNMGIQNTQQFAQLHNPQAIANALKQGAPSLATSSLGVNSASISPSIQQKILQQSLLDQRPNPANAQSVQQQQKLLQQQQQQQILVQQLRLAVTHGLISPQTLNQPFSPQMLNVLQQMLQGQAVLQRLQTQQQMILQNKNPITQRQQMEQVRLMTKKMEQQILGLQQQLGQAQQQAFNRDGSQASKDDLNTDFSNLSMKEPSPPANPGQPAQSQSSNQPASSQPQTSRLTQWKLPSPEKSDAASDESKKSLAHSASATNLPSQAGNGQSKFEFTRSLSIGGDSTWSSTNASSSSDWPSSSASSAITTTAISEAQKTDAKSPNEDGNRASPATNSTFPPSFNDMIPEFVPGKPWQGVATKNIEDDPHITPGSVSRSLSVNTIKDDYLNSFTNKAMSATTTESVSSAPMNWNSRPKWQPTGSGASNDMWGKGNTRAPPGIPNPKANWSSGPGPQMSRAGSLSWAGDKSAFSAVPSQTSYDPRSAGSPILILKNLTPQTDTGTLQTLCMQHGTIVGFQANQSLALVEYSSREEAVRAQKSLNGCPLGGASICAELLKSEQSPAGQQQPQQQQPVWQQQQQVGYGGQMPNFRNTAPPKPDMGTGHWNGASGFHGVSGGMWSSGANASPWGTGLLQNDLLGSESM